MAFIRIPEVRMRSIDFHNRNTELLLLYSIISPYHEYTVSNTSRCFLFSKRKCSLSSSSDTSSGILPVLVVVFSDKEGSTSHKESTQFKTFCSIWSFPQLKTGLLLTSVCKFDNALSTNSQGMGLISVYLN